MEECIEIIIYNKQKGIYDKKKFLKTDIWKLIKQDYLWREYNPLILYKGTILTTKLVRISKATGWDEECDFYEIAEYIEQRIKEIDNKINKGDDKDV